MFFSINKRNVSRQSENHKLSCEMEGDRHREKDRGGEREGAGRERGGRERRGVERERRGRERETSMFSIKDQYEQRNVRIHHDN